MATQQDIQDAIALSGAFNNLSGQIDYGRDYGGRAAKKAAQDAAATIANFGGDAQAQAKLDTLMADPQVYNYFKSQAGSGSFLGGLVNSLGEFAGEAGIKEGLMLASLVTGANSLGLFGDAAGAVGGVGNVGMSAAELAAADPYLASIAGASGITPAMETAGMLSAASSPGVAASTAAGNVATGLSYDALGTAATGSGLSSGATQLANKIIQQSPGFLSTEAKQAIVSQVGGMTDAEIAAALESGQYGGMTGALTPAEISAASGQGGSLAGTLSSIGGGNTLGSLVSAGTALYGAQQGVNAANDATAELRRQFDIGQANTAPWLEAGKNALGAQQDLMGLGTGGAEAQLSSLMNAPGYQFRLKQGQKGLDASSAARGGMGSGKAATSAMNWNQDYASNEYNNRLNQLAGLSGTGQTQANQNMNAGMNYAGEMGNSALAAGQARQSGILGAGQALSGWLNPQPKQRTLADLLKGL